MDKKVSHQMFLLVSTILVGAGSGIIAAAATQQSMRDYLEALTSRTDFEVITDVKPRSLPDTYEEAIARIHEVAGPTLALVRPKTKDVTSATGIVIQGDGLSAIAVTSDGWLLMSTDDLRPYARPREQLEVWIDGERYAIIKTVPDSLNGLTLIKIDARNLSAVPFGESNDFVGGEMLFVMTANAIRPTSLSSNHVVAKALVPAEFYATKWQLADQTPGLVVNVGGELVAVAIPGGVAVPIDQITPFIQTVLRSDEARYAGIGAMVMELSSVLNLDHALRQGREQGAYIGSVVPNSPAQKAGLKAQDIITAVDGLPIESGEPLSIHLKRYSINNTVVLTVWRANQEITLNVVLGSNKDLVY